MLEPLDTRVSQASAARANAKAGQTLRLALWPGLLAFWQGFTQPSVLAFRAFGVSLLATLALCLWFFSESTLGGPFGRYLPRSGIDDDGFATREALMAARQTGVLPRLIILGTSTVAQAVGSGKDLEQRIAERTGQSWQVVVLTTAGQSPVEQFALIDHALAQQQPDSPPAIVVVGFGPQRFRWTPEKSLDSAMVRRLGLRSDWEDAEVQVLGGTPLPRTGFYPWDNRNFVALNGARALLRLVLQQPAVRRVDYFARGHQGPEAQEVRDNRGTRIREGFPNRDLYHDQLGRLAANVVSRPNTQLVVIEETMAPGMIENQSLGPIYDQMRREMAELGRHQGFAFWPIATEARLTDADFHDDMHIRPGPAQDILRDMIARHMAHLLTANGATDGI
jgi:hypothetical protein